MAAVFETYEKQFATITADITARIGRIPNLVGTEKKTAVGVVQGNIDEARELLEQMDLELYDAAPDVRPALIRRVENFKRELSRLRKEFRTSQVAVGGASMRKELFGNEPVTSEDHRERLLDSTSRLDKTSNRLEEGHRIVMETEQIGMDIMNNLQRDRGTIQRARSRLRETDADITQGGRIVSRIRKRIIQHKVFFIVGIIVMLLIIALLIFAIVMIKKSQN
ncbi:vesicle transport through interaction with t-SNAREs homolog 1A-like [Halichondria panicea]|uniref:vesicle transport through interaction with t-SNAREs homolog 1A-like n=1 Tax=Halichondria panicea TaxID=6063 RepID=UPI00312B3F03